MPCKRLQPSHRPSANSLTLVPTGTTEYIAAGDSQAAVPLPTEILYIIQRALSKRRHGFTMRETLPWKNTHMGLPGGESGHTDT